MKKHNGMRPHDIVVLLKIASYGNQNWYMKDLAFGLGISTSEISESINRSIIAGLISSDKKSLNKLSLIDFLKSGLRYVYPQIPGALVRGIPTAHSAPPLNKLIIGEDQYVWPHAAGKTKGSAIEPLHPKLPDACLNDNILYEFIALTDAIRVGKARELNIAVDLLKDKIENA